MDYNRTGNYTTLDHVAVINHDYPMENLPNNAGSGLPWSSVWWCLTWFIKSSLKLSQTDLCSLMVISAITVKTCSEWTWYIKSENKFYLFTMNRHYGQQFLSNTIIDHSSLWWFDRNVYINETALLDAWMHRHMDRWTICNS